MFHIIVIANLRFFVYVFEMRNKYETKTSTVFDMLLDCAYSFVGYIYRASQDVSESENAKLKVLWTVWKYIARFDIAVLCLL